LFNSLAADKEQVKVEVKIEKDRLYLA